MYISKIHIENIRCFKKITVNLSLGDKPIMWTTLLGDNSTGKTTFLKCVALGLCDESSSAGLLREAEEGYIRHNEVEGSIEITLSDEKGNYKGRITTKIIKVETKRYTFEKLSQVTDPDSKFNPSNFPWGNIFICAYGIGRGVSGAGDITGYSPISAVYNLFNYSEGLQNPELVIKRSQDTDQSNIKTILKAVLNLPEDATIDTSGNGIKIKGGPFKKETALRDIADGYRSTFLWVADFLGWAISYWNKRFIKGKFRGIVLVDAFEEHLHPQWQRTIVKKIKLIFPNIQFIVTTHSPLVASGTTDFVDANLIELFHNDNQIVYKIIERKEVHGKRADQMLRSEAFNMQSTTSPGADNEIIRYYNLKSKKDSLGLDKDELSEFSELENKISMEYSLKDNKYEEEVERVMDYVFSKLLKRSPDEIHKLIMNRELKKLFGDIENEKN